MWCMPSRPKNSDDRTCDNPLLHQLYDGQGWLNVIECRGNRSWSGCGTFYWRPLQARGQVRRKRLARRALTSQPLASNCSSSAPSLYFITCVSTKYKRCVLWCACELSPCMFHLTRRWWMTIDSRFSIGVVLFHIAQFTSWADPTLWYGVSRFAFIILWALGHICAFHCTAGSWGAQHPKEKNSLRHVCIVWW